MPETPRSSTALKYRKSSSENWALSVPSFQNANLRTWGPSGGFFFRKNSVLGFVPEIGILWFVP